MSLRGGTAVAAVPSVVAEPVDPSIRERQPPERSPSSSSSSASSIMNEDSASSPSRGRLQRPDLGSRKSSGTMVIPREGSNAEASEEQYDEDDARMMSPRRTTEEIERLSLGAKEALIEQAKALQASLLDLVDRVETVKSEHEKLEGGNKFLQSYIGELMQTSKITSTGAGKGKGKGRSTK